VICLGYINGIIQSVQTLFINLFEQPNWRDFLDIFIISILIYECLKLMIRTRSATVLKGVFVLVLMAWLTDALQLNVVSWIVRQLLNTGVVVVVILFQPEIRTALEQLGRTAHVAPSQNHSRAKNAQRSVSELVQAVTDMSRKRIGALIVFEKHTGLTEFAETGTYVNADISAPLIENIFEPNTPLHDGATIIRNGRVLASACILNLSHDPGISKELGTRHMAAIGVTETTDATALIVSEETGVISYARDGKISRYMDVKALTSLLTELLDADSGSSLSHRFRLSSIKRPAKGGNAE